MSGNHSLLSVSARPRPDYGTPDVAAAVISILLLIMTFVYAWMVLRNFGRGLKDQSTSTITYSVPLNLTLFSSLAKTGGCWRKAQRVPVVVCAA
jgi:hypothetical protein